MTAEIYIGLYSASRRKFILNRANPVSIGKADLIKAFVCDYMQQNVSSVEGYNRKRELSITRQICMYFISTKTELTLLRIGKMFGNRDHSTIIHARETINDLMDVDKHFKAKIAAINQLLETEINEHFKAA